MLLNRNCCCRSLFIIGIETRLVSLCFVLSTSFYRERREKERGGGRGHCCGGCTYSCRADSFVRMRNILSHKKKHQKLVSAFSRRLLFSLLRQADSSLLLLRFVSQIHLFLGNLFVYITFVCVCGTGERSKNKPSMKMNYARLLFFGQCQQQFPYLITPIT